MQSDLYKNLEEALSEEKLNAYRERKAGCTDREIFAHFLWNVQLSESLYPGLQALEVALRNRLCQAVEDKFGGEFHLVAHKFLAEREMESFNKAEEELQKLNKTITKGLIIEELKFGFWTSLFDRRYEHNSVLWPSLLKETLPRAPKYFRTRQELSKRLNKIRQLRNKIFHHCSIWHWQDLSAQHCMLFETIGWLSPEIKDMISSIDRFPEVYKNGYLNCLNYMQKLEEKHLVSVSHAMPSSPS